MICIAACDGLEDVQNLQQNDYRPLGQLQQDRMLNSIDKIVIAEGRGCGWISYSKCQDIFCFGMFWIFWVSYFFFQKSPGRLGVVSPCARSENWMGCCKNF